MKKTQYVILPGNYNVWNDEAIIDQSKIHYDTLEEAQEKAYAFSKQYNDNQFRVCAVTCYICAAMKVQ